MLKAITKLTRSVVLLVLLSLMLTSVARANSNPKKLPAVAAAMQKAQNIYLYATDSNPAAKQITSSKDFLIFYNGVQALDRYQFVPTPGQADLILRYDAHFNARTIVLLDPTTLLEIGEFWSGGSGASVKDASLAKAANADIRQVVQFIGSSAAKTPPVPLPAPVSRPNPALTLGAISDELRSFQTVYIVDYGVYKNFPPKKLPYQPGQLKALFMAQLTNWGHYKVVDSLAQADVLVELQGVTYTDTEFAGLSPKGKQIYSSTSSPMIQLTLAEAKTLYMLKSSVIAPQTKVKKGKPDPREATMRNVFDVFTGLVDLPRT